MLVGAEENFAIHQRRGGEDGLTHGVARQDTALAKSRLLIEDVEVAIFCPNCGAERPAREFPFLTCAQCGASAERIVHGQELEIAALEILA